MEAREVLKQFWLENKELAAKFEGDMSLVGALESMVKHVIEDAACETFSRCAQMAYDGGCYRVASLIKEDSWRCKTF